MAALKWISAVIMLIAANSVLADRLSSPGVEVNVPPDVFTSGSRAQETQPCMQCCVYDNRNYTEGAVIKTEGVLLQCQRDEHVFGTNPLVWRRVKP
ncbi:YnjH family protein [Salmonella enterica]